MSLQPTSDRSIPTVLRQYCKRLAWPVWNPEHDRLRAPIRALLPTVLSFLALAVSQSAIRARFGHPVRELVEMTSILLVLGVTVLVSARLIDRRPVHAFGLDVDREWWRSFAVGGLIATLVNAGALLVALWAGWATVTGFAEGSASLPFLPAMAVVLGYIAIAAAWEEFIFRGAMLQNLAEGANGYVPRWLAIAVAVLLSSAVFAFLHGGKVTDPSLYAYYLIAGLVFGVAYVLTGSLSLPIGFHVFYNFTQSAVFGLGHSQRTPELIAVELVGPTRWMGEEGIVFSLFAILGGLLLIGYIRWRDGTLQLDDRITRWTPR